MPSARDYLNALLGETPPPGAPSYDTTLNPPAAPPAMQPPQSGGVPDMIQGAPGAPVSSTTTTPVTGGPPSSLPTQPNSVGEIGFTPMPANATPDMTMLPDQAPPAAASAAPGQITPPPRAAVTEENDSVLKLLQGINMARDTGEADLDTAVAKFKAALGPDEATKPTYSAGERVALMLMALSGNTDQAQAIIQGRKKDAENAAARTRAKNLAALKLGSEFVKNTTQQKINQRLLELKTLAAVQADQSAKSLDALRAANTNLANARTAAVGTTATKPVTQKDVASLAARLMQSNPRLARNSDLAMSTARRMLEQGDTGTGATSSAPTAAATEASGTASGAVHVTSPAEAAKLAPGTQFITPDGKIYTRK